MTALWIIDAFASAPFKGNPAAICLLDAFPDDAIMQQIAFEINLSETAFLVATGPLSYRLRWFTPVAEVNLCGHATLAATHFLAESGLITSGERVTYRTQSGALAASLSGGLIELDFPCLAGESVSQIPETLDALGVSITACERNRDNYLVEVKDFQALQDCTPDFRKLLSLDLQGVIVTTAQDVPRGFDFASRYFGTPCGVDEDPVTGSAHCFLAPYWARKLGRTTFNALQSSRREGELRVGLSGDRVTIAGKAFTTLKAELNIPLHAAKEQAA